MKTPEAESLVWQDFADHPTTEGYLDWMGAFTSKVKTLSDDIQARYVSLIGDEFDSALCEANGCVAAGADGSPAPVGFHLSGDRDEHQSWHWTSVVVLPADVDYPEAHVMVVCEECSPGGAYQRPEKRN